MRDCVSQFAKVAAPSAPAWLRRLLSKDGKQF
jgi:hypothetical protein